MSEENNKQCKEYNSLKYRTMIMTGHNIDDKDNNEASEVQLDNFLLSERQASEKQSWSKLSKTERLKKLNSFIRTNLVKLYELNEDEEQKLKIFLYSLVERKRIVKVNEIKYNEETGMIEDIPVIVFNSKSRRFTFNKTLSSQNLKKTRKKK